MLTSEIVVAGPYYDELSVGQVFEEPPGMTLTDGHAALHQAILGDRLRLALDADLAAHVTGDGPPPAHPGLVCDVAIGQSTLATQRVIANLFYRGLALRRSPRIGDTLRTVTEVVALRDTSERPGRAPTGLAALRVVTVDQLDRPVLDYYRCAMLPMRPGSPRPGHTADLNAISSEINSEALTASVDGWDLSEFRARVPGPHADGIRPGTTYVLENGDTVTGATELARLSLNVAGAHTDPGATGTGRRLVYGGHTIGIAFSQAVRALPNLVTVVAWRSCDHLAPVFEGDVLRSSVTIDAVDELDGPGALVEVRLQTDADRVDESGIEPVLDWRLVGVMA